MKLNNPILVVDDDEVTLELFKYILDQLDVSYLLSKNGKEALEITYKQEISIFIVDLIMPIMDGKSFIVEIKKRMKDPIIIVQTGDDSTTTVIEVMKMGVFDYLIKPFNLEELRRILQKAIEYKYLKELEAVSTSANLKLKSQIEWLNYKDTKRIENKDYNEIKNIENIKHSLMQGGGIGAIISLLDIIESDNTFENNKVLIDEEYFKLLIESKTICKMQMDAIAKTNQLIEEKINLEFIECKDLVAGISYLIKDIIPCAEKKKITFKYPNSVQTGKVFINKKSFQIILEELAINAYKYSTPDSKINIYTNISEGYYIISIKNFISENPYTGIPSEMEKKVLEPFFRMNQFVDEEIAKIEKYGIGLGLTVVDNLVKKHNGLFFIHEVKDHTIDKVKTAVVAEIFLPITKAL